MTFMVESDVYDVAPDLSCAPDTNIFSAFIAQIGHVGVAFRSGNAYRSTNEDTAYMAWERMTSEIESLSPSHQQYVGDLTQLGRKYDEYAGNTRPDVNDTFAQLLHRISTERESKVYLTVTSIAANAEALLWVSRQYNVLGQHAPAALEALKKAKAVLAADDISFDDAVCAQLDEVLEGLPRGSAAATMASRALLPPIMFVTQRDAAVKGPAVASLNLYNVLSTLKFGPYEQDAFYDTILDDCGSSIIARTNNVRYHQEVPPFVDAAAH